MNPQNGALYLHTQGRAVLVRAVVLGQDRANELMQQTPALALLDLIETAAGPICFLANIDDLGAPDPTIAVGEKLASAARQIERADRARDTAMDALSSLARAALDAYTQARNIREGRG